LYYYLEFFFDGDFVISKSGSASSDGLHWCPTLAETAGQIPVNGELNKWHTSPSATAFTPAFTGAATLTHPYSWRGPAISILRMRRWTYQRERSQLFTKIDGTTATISNQ